PAYRPKEQNRRRLGRMGEVGATTTRQVELFFSLSASSTLRASSSSSLAFCSPAFRSLPFDVQLFFLQASSFEPSCLMKQHREPASTLRFIAQLSVLSSLLLTGWRKRVPCEGG
ncbi:hypothetical protein A4X06_0g4311, partial [Tilletia controversa]